MVRELLRRSLGAVFSSTAASTEDRLSKLEAQVAKLSRAEQITTEDINDLSIELDNIRVQVGEWTGVRSSSHNE